ncbi:hypothetical protein HanPI659440_Chr16g0656261 [Helianthus annuus]|uniref:Uncharacterized protein n=1 Tax=Helianthus annuus TaxID=4232 RepID=A0A251VNX8_HELAN|nr:hypothetical protein HanXRQr2_Chr01g0016141 [Helianthus annuus]KAJ0611260.1 hypothetical protein HanHA300_Chr01g0013191 [Helianthus annuus]KAJ0626542.1 hypothetical protein HanHA89_Chr01g0014351 [Helianthus annuus]KAJ0683246.1 hypothetical protein HanPI659440_Chr16g0656261 [Helianthus annuus]KAJ0902040.1 hypothetical protein HanPSC8_Chr08g0332371 [Helianthus annuus]
MALTVTTVKRLGFRLSSGIFPVTMVKRLGFRSSSGIFPVISGEVPAKIPGNEL